MELTCEALVQHSRLCNNQDLYWLICYLQQMHVAAMRLQPHVLLY